MLRANIFVSIDVAEKFELGISKPALCLLVGQAGVANSLEYRLQPVQVLTENGRRNDNIVEESITP